MKCIYTESLIIDSGAQIILCPTNAENVMDKEQELFQHCFPEAKKSLENMFTASDHGEEQPRLGDVIWFQPSQNRYIGFCIVRNTPMDEISLPALEVCCKSVNKKCIEFQQVCVGMGQFDCNGDDWSKIVDTIEDTLEPQLVVCLPKNEILMDFVNKLPRQDELKTMSFDINSILTENSIH
jgi:hypothetical protein